MHDLRVMEGGHVDLWTWAFVPSLEGKTLHKLVPFEPDTARSVATRFAVQEPNSSSTALL